MWKQTSRYVTWQTEPENQIFLFTEFPINRIAWCKNLARRKIIDARQRITKEGAADLYPFRPTRILRPADIDVTKRFSQIIGMGNMKTIQSSCPYLPLVLGLCLGGYLQSVSGQSSEAFKIPGSRVIETGILQNVTGFKGDVLGAEVVSISPGADDTQVIDILIPVDPDEVDLVHVLTPDGNPLKQKQAMEIIFDHENGEVGVRLNLAQTQKMGFKIKLIDLSEHQP